MVKTQQLLRDNAVINIIEISGELFKEKIIKSDIQEIKAIPEDKPSKPSNKLIAFVIPIIHIIVIKIETISTLNIEFKACI